MYLEEVLGLEMEVKGCSDLDLDLVWNQTLKLSLSLRKLNF